MEFIESTLCYPGFLSFKFFSIYVCSVVLGFIQVKGGPHLTLVNKFSSAMTLTIYIHTYIEV